MTDTPCIMIVDDQIEILENLAFTIQSAGYHSLEATDGLQALQLLATHAVDLIICDIAMPDMNGYQFFERVRSNPHWSRIPVVFLTARALASDIRYGKELGVDDYLTKPIQRDDLLSTVKGKLRRAQQLHDAFWREAATGPTPDSHLITYKGLTIDEARHMVWRDGQLIQLTVREFAVLCHLVSRATMVVSPHELIRIANQIETDDDEARELLRHVIRALRRKLGYPVGDPGCIENVRGVGYRFDL